MSPVKNLCADLHLRTITAWFGGRILDSRWQIGVAIIKFVADITSPDD